MPYRTNARWESRRWGATRAAKLNVKAVRYWRWVVLWVLIVPFVATIRLLTLQDPFDF